MSGYYAYADGTAVSHYSRNARLAARLYRRLRDAGMSAAESSAAGVELLRSLDSATGVKRNYSAWLRK